MSHEHRESGSSSSESLRRAIEQFRATARDLYAKEGAPPEPGGDLEQDLQQAQLYLRAALEVYDSGAALLSSDGVILVANDAFERRGYGRAGESPADPLLDVLMGDGDVEASPGTRIVVVSMDAPTGRETFEARVTRIGDPDGTILLVVGEPRGDSRTPPRA